jgi:ABC-type arginine transport system ATPase subunit
MNSSNKLIHDLSNDVESIFQSFETIELKLKRNDISGALKTIELVKDSKAKALALLSEVKNKLNSEK